MPREIVTSENREEYMEQKLAEKAGMKPMESTAKEKAKKMEDEQFERVMKHPKYAKLKMKLGKKGALDALLKEMNDKQ